MTPSRSSYYDTEARVYDESRGGRDRAVSAADAVVSLVPPRGVALDVAGGTGIVSAELAARGLDVVVADLSPGMLGVAAERLPGRAVVATADRLPVADAAVDLVTMVWLLARFSGRSAWGSADGGDPVFTLAAYRKAR